MKYFMIRSILMSGKIETVRLHRTLQTAMLCLTAQGKKETWKMEI